MTIIFLRYVHHNFQAQMVTKQLETPNIKERQDSANNTFYLIITLTITVTLFTVEALMHYNIGLNGSPIIRNFPVGDELALILFTCFLFATLSIFLSNMIINFLKSKFFEEENKKLESLNREFILWLWHKKRLTVNHRGELISNKNIQK